MDKTNTCYNIYMNHTLFLEMFISAGIGGCVLIYFYYLDDIEKYIFQYLYKKRVDKYQDYMESRRS